MDSFGFLFKGILLKQFLDPSILLLVIFENSLCVFVWDDLQPTTKFQPGATEIFFCQGFIPLWPHLPLSKNLKWMVLNTQAPITGLLVIT
jgi:hypothetical protein